MIAVLAVVAIALPLLWGWRLAWLDEPSRVRWLVKAADIVAFIAFVLLIARWDILGFHTRTAILLIAAAAGIWSWRRHARRPWRAGPAWPRAKRWSTLGSLALMLGLVGYVLTGLLPPADAQPLACPLSGGTFVVGQGGGNRLLNHHAGHPAQAHAADIVALGPSGFRAAGALPADLQRYAVYHARVASPCDGTVVAAHDGLPDRTPPESDTAMPAGNHVILACGPITIELAHLSPGSLAVGPGDNVAVGTPIGLVGNSGNSTEPHLHLHATGAGGGAVPVTIAGDSLVRNRRLAC